MDDQAQDFGLEISYRSVTPDPIHQLATHIIKGVARPNEKIVTDHQVLKKLIAHMRSMGCVIVFTTGVWDMHHIGHDEYLLKAKDSAIEFYPGADHIILVVGADTDALTKERKGPKRPVVPEDERYKILSHVWSVDIVTPQYLANQLYKLVEHDIRVISTSTSDLPSDHEDIQRQCAYLVNLPPQAETSASARIRSLVMDGGLEALSRFKVKLDTLLKELEDELSK